MFSIIRLLFPLILSCFFLYMATGLLNTVLPLRMELEGLQRDEIGLVLSFYFIGMLLGTIYSKDLIKRAGHIRLVSGCGALTAACVLVFSLYADTILWAVLRVLIGFCNACILTAMESWFSESASKENRGKVLSLYNATLMLGLFGGQFFIGFSGAAGAVLFVVCAIIFCFSIIPVTLGRSSGPEVSDITPMPLFSLLKLSPLGVISCIVSGIAYNALFSLLPIIAKSYGFIDFTLSMYMGMAILGAFILQFPVGYLSDRFDRRTVLVVILIISASVDGVLAFVDPKTGAIWPVFLLTAVTSGIISCIYPLSVSQALDKLRQTEIVGAMASMLMAFAIGGVIGPYSSSLVMDNFGDSAMFFYLAAIQIGLVFFVIYRMTISEALPVDEQEHFVMQGAISRPMSLDPRTEYIEDQTLCAEAETAVSVAESDPAAAVRMASAMAKANPSLGVEVAAAVATVEGIDALRLYEVMSEAVPGEMLDVTRAMVEVKPDLGYELVHKLAEIYPDQVVPVAIEIGRVLPELRIDMARIAVEAAPESATEVAEYYTRLLHEEREAMRPADRDEESEQHIEEWVTQISEVVHHDDDDHHEPDPNLTPNQA